MADSTLKQARWVLLASVLITAVLYAVPEGYFVIYPFMLLSTYAHEMGHGLVAELVGGDFLQFQMWSDGSGVAHWSGHVGRFQRAIIAAGGLVGPSLFAALLFAMARRPKWARAGIVGLGIAFALSGVLVVRNSFGWVFVFFWAGLLLLAGRFAKPWLSQLLSAFLAVQMAMSVFSRVDYLFASEAVTAAGNLPSDVAQIAAALFFPYWFWGIVCGGISLLILVVGLHTFFKLPIQAHAPF